MNRICHHILFAIIMLLPHVLLAQKDTMYFKQITIADGLNDNTITAICQDDEGYIWIGTHDGLHRYDGSSIKLIHKSNTNSSIPNNFIFALKNLGDHKLGIITNEGFRVLNTKTYQGINYQVPCEPAFFLYCNKVWDILEIKGSGYFCSTITGLFWFAYDGKIIWRYDHYNVKDISKPMRYGRELQLLADDKVLFYSTKNYDANIFDIRSKKILDKKNVAHLLEYIPQQTRSTWRSFTGTNNWIYVTEPGIDSITGYNPHLKKIVHTKLPLKSNEYAWPGKLYGGNDSTLLQAASSGGFVILHIDKRTGKVFTDAKKYLPGLLCKYLFTDHNNRIWAGTENGLFVQQFHEPVIKTYPVPSDKEHASRLPDIFDLLTTSDDIFTCAVNQRGVIQTDIKTWQVKKTILLNPDISSDWNAVLMISRHTTDTILIGSRLGLGWYNIRTGKTGLYAALKKEGIENFNNCFTDSRGYTWFSCSGPNGTAIARYENKTGVFELISQKKPPYFLPMAYVSFFTEDAFGNIWMGDHGITRFNYQKNRFDTFINVFDGYRKYEDQLFGLSADKSGNIWITTVQNGLLKYAINENKYSHHTAKTGLSSDLVIELSPVIKNRIFIATRNKLNMLDLSSNHITVYAQTDGLPESSISTPVFYDSNRNNIWIGYHNQVAAIPFMPLVNMVPEPKLTIESLTIRNDSTQYFPSGKIFLKYNQNNISIGLSSLDFEGIENNKIFYRLHETDEWRNAEQNKFIYLDNLESGKYQLQVKLTSIARRWPDQVRSLEIIIRPPFWKTTWFLVLCSLLIILISYLLNKNRINNIRYRNNLDKQLVELEIKALHTQMNPHFIFNCLNSIKEMILTGQKENASKYLSTFAQLLRDTLEQSTHSFSSLEETINHLERYISIEQIRFDNFIYNISIDKTIVPSEINLPPMLLQPLVENAIWHGLQPLKGEKRLNLSFMKKQHELICIIEDNGIGLNQSFENKQHEKNHHSIAIENINKRISLLNEKFLLSYKLEMADKKDLSGYTGSGTVVTLTIPIDNE